MPIMLCLTPSPMWHIETVRLLFKRIVTVFLPVGVFLLIGIASAQQYVLSTFAGGVGHLRPRLQRLFRFLLLSVSQRIRAGMSFSPAPAVCFD